MAKQKRNSAYKLSRNERTALVVCSTIMVSFILLVLIATGGSLFVYTLLHILLAGLTISVLLIDSPSKILIRTAIVFGVIGASFAVFLILAYLPWYMSYL